MTRLFSLLIALALIILILVDLTGKHRSVDGGADPGRETRQHAPAARPAVTRQPSAPTPDVRSLPLAGPGADVTPPPDGFERLAVRRRLRGEGQNTYLDSMITGSDSTIRRWPDLNGERLRVAMTLGGPKDFRGVMADYLRQALDDWEALGVGIRFAIVDDTAGAEITVRWIDRFPKDRAGQTDLIWDKEGRIHHATIVLAVHDSSGYRLPDAGLRAVAIHETGHAIGLPHSSDPADVMYPSARASSPTDRDRRTVALLYDLPPGDIRDPTDQPKPEMPGPK